jgi:hypothetical protein
MRPTRASASLRAALERAYLTFAPYAASSPLRACPHCDAPETTATIATTPPTQLRASDLDEYAFKAVSTWGDANDLRRVLPRLLELAWAGELRALPFVVSTKLRAAGWERWPSRERQAVDDLLRALFVRELTSAPGRIGSVAAVAGVTEAVDDAQPFLDDWHLLLSAGFDERVAALRHLVELVDAAAVVLSDHAYQVRYWLLGQTTTLQLERAMFDFAGTPFERPLMRAATSIIRLRDALAVAESA